jgi:hypothetical protein
MTPGGWSQDGRRSGLHGSGDRNGSIVDQCIKENVAYRRAQAEIEPAVDTDTPQRSCPTSTLLTRFASVNENHDDNEG